MKPRFFIIVAVIAILVIAIIAASASSGSRKKNPAGLITCTVNGDIGIEQVMVTNLNTGKHNIKTAAQLPWSFNLTEGDSLRVNATTTDGFIWVSWELNQHPWFAHDNPFTIINVAEDLVLNPQTIAR